MFSKLELLHSVFYYIHTEKYSPKSYVVNFRTQISSSQSEERTMAFSREKNYTSNQNRERCFFTCVKNDTSNQKPQSCVSFAPKFPPFIRELTNRRLSHDAAAGSRHSSALPSCRNLSLRFVAKTTTLVRAAGKFSRRF